MKTIILLTLFAFAGSPAFARQNFNITGEYIEGCSCSPPCGCVMTGLEMGCQGVGALRIDSGSYGGVDLAGVRIAYGLAPAKWVRGYVMAKNPAQQKAAESFAAAWLKSFGKVESIVPAPVTIAGKNGSFTVWVDDAGGKRLYLVTRSVRGGDQHSPITHTNINDALSTVFYQAITVTGSYHDGGHAFKLKESNAYYNPGVNKSGKM